MKSTVKLHTVYPYLDLERKKNSNNQEEQCVMSQWQTDVDFEWYKKKWNKFVSNSGVS